MPQQQETKRPHYKPSSLDIGFLKRKSSAVFDDPLPSRIRSYTKPLVVKKRQLKKITPQSNVRPRIYSFSLVLLIMLSGLQLVNYLSSAHKASGEILGLSTSAYEDLTTASTSLESRNFDEAKVLFAQATADLEQAKDRLDEFRTLTWLTPQGKSADHILAGAYYLSLSGEKLTVALSLFDDLKVSRTGVETDSFTDKLLENRNLFAEALDLLKQADSHFEKGRNIPGEYAETINVAKEQVGQLSGILDNLIGLEDLYLAFFGRGEKTYLLIFQNPDEMRATGGFIGTYGVLKIDNGKIMKLAIESIYNLDGQIYEAVAAPGPFQPDIQKWGIRDANWFVDFRMSAKKLLYFFEKGSQTADGVIATTPRLFAQLLSLVGPIHMDQYGVVLTPENFQEVVQFKTSYDYDRSLNQPKKFLADFAPILLDRLQDLKKESWFAFFQVLKQNLADKHVLLYSREQEVQDEIEALGFAGAVADAQKDYLMIADSNLGGTKTDLEINTAVKLSTKVMTDGSLINTLQITRENQSAEQNRNYLRILVPEGSELISAEGMDEMPHNGSLAEGFKIDPDLAVWDQGVVLWNKIFVREEANKTEFAAWVITEPSTSRTLTFVYSLPFKMTTNFFDQNKEYSLVLQKQAGSKPYDFRQVLDFSQRNIVWSTPNVAINGQTAQYAGTINADMYWALILSE